MASLNKCMFIGNLGADPESRSTRDGKQVVSLRLACSESWKGRDGQRQERTEWVQVVIWNEGLAKVASQYLRKGSRVFVSGKLQTRKWQDQSGADRFTTEVVLQNFDGELVLLDSREQSDGQRGGGTPRTGRNPDFDSDLDDDVPFIRAEGMGW